MASAKKRQNKKNHRKAPKTDNKNVRNSKSAVEKEIEKIEANIEVKNKKREENDVKTQMLIASIWNSIRVGLIIVLAVAIILGLISGFIMAGLVVTGNLDKTDNWFVAFQALVGVASLIVGIIALHMTFTSEKRSSNIFTRSKGYSQTIPNAGIKPKQEYDVKLIDK